MSADRVSTWLHTNPVAVSTGSSSVIDGKPFWVWADGVPYASADLGEIPDTVERLHALGIGEDHIFVTAAGQLPGESHAPAGPSAAERAGKVIGVALGSLLCAFVALCVVALAAVAVRGSIELLEWAL